MKTTNRSLLIGVILLGCFYLCGCGATTVKESFTDNTGQGQINEEISDINEPKQEYQEVVTESGDTTLSESMAVSESTGAYDFTLCFAGDINLDDKWSTMLHLDQQEKGILDCISPELVSVMQESDIMCLNNEFTFSTEGEPLPGKRYIFRAHPDRVEILNTLGVDVVSLANNHAFDFGSISLLQTMDTLKKANISYVGAGADLEEAMEPFYYELDGKTIAIVAGSRAEKNKMTPQATDTQPGILRCYEPELLKQTIKKAKEHADYCILFIHWGTEYSTKLEDVQVNTGKEYMDAGADVIIGAHPHCLQGIEFYEGKPIIYSLGNYWFNEKILDTMLLQLRFYGNKTEEHLEVKVIPGLQKDCETTYVSDKVEQRAFFDRLEELSIEVEISDEGVVTETK